MSKIARICSGGQSGSDRAALDEARANGVTICGWCPKYGWAEDYPEAPGLLIDYPELRETSSSEVEQRTEWNVRDSDATIIIAPCGTHTSRGTLFTERMAQEYERPYLIVSEPDKITKIQEWLELLPSGITLNVAGPRKSECETAYEVTRLIMRTLLSKN